MHVCTQAKCLLQFTRFSSSTVMPSSVGAAVYLPSFKYIHQCREESNSSHDSLQFPKSFISAAARPSPLRRRRSFVSARALPLVLRTSRLRVIESVYPNALHRVAHAFHGSSFSHAASPRYVNGFVTSHTARLRRDTASTPSVASLRRRFQSYHRFGSLRIKY